MFAGFTGGLVRLRETLKSEEADPPGGRERQSFNGQNGCLPRRVQEGATGGSDRKGAARGSATPSSARPRRVKAGLKSDVGFKLTRAPAGGSIPLPVP